MNEWWPARQIVTSALADTVRAAGQSILAGREDEARLCRQIVVLPKFCPWTGHLLDLEKEQGTPAEDGAKYVLFEDTSGQWRVRAVPTAEGAFSNRLPLPSAWRGLRDQELSQQAGIDGCVFVHSSGFIGGHRTKDGAMAMARKALEMGASA